MSTLQVRSFAEHRMRVDFEFPNHFLAAICGRSARAQMSAGNGNNISD